VNDQLIDTPVPVDQSVQAPIGHSVAFSKAACAIEPIAIQSEATVKAILHIFTLVLPLTWSGMFPIDIFGLHNLALNI